MQLNFCLTAMQISYKKKLKKPWYRDMLNFKRLKLTCLQCFPIAEKKSSNIHITKRASLSACHIILTCNNYRTYFFI